MIISEASNQNDGFLDFTVHSLIPEILSGIFVQVLRKDLRASTAHLSEIACLLAGAVARRDGPSANGQDAVLQN